MTIECTNCKKPITKHSKNIDKLTKEECFITIWCDWCGATNFLKYYMWPIQ